jgi:AbrB family looped-hinge helix DNA binding protein
MSLFIYLTIMPQPAPLPRFFNAKLNENGRIVIPVAVRDQMGLKPGEALVLEIDADGILRLESHRAHIRRIQQEFALPADPVAQPAARQLPASQQLIEEREEEVTHQMEEWLG